MDEVLEEGSLGSMSSDGFDTLQMDSRDRDSIERDEFVEINYGRRAISSGEQSLDGSIDEERSALSDSEIVCGARTQTIAKQVKGPSSDALEGDCMNEHLSRMKKEYEWEDVLGSGQLLKKIIKEGHGEHPTDECQVVINVDDTLHRIDSHEGLLFILGYSYVIDAWEIIVKLMRVGEICQVKSSSRFAYGDIGLDPSIPSNQDQEYTEYEKAIFVYKRAVSTWYKLDESYRLKWIGSDRIICALHSNLAVSYAKLCDWKSCLQSSNDSLELHKDNPKALFRKGQALNRIGEAEEAIKVLLEACNIDPKDKSIEKELDDARRANKDIRMKEKHVYKKMLSGISDDNDNIHNNKNNYLFYITIASISIVVIAFLLHLFYSNN